VAIAAGPRAPPLAAHALDDVGHERLDGNVPALLVDVQRPLDRVMDHAAAPHLARRELLEDIEEPAVGGGVGGPAPPGAAVVQVVLAPAVLKRRVPAARP